MINVSLGGLAVSANYDSQASAWLSEIAQTYGVLILLAADNAGPGLSSGTTIGRSNELMTIGAYYSPGDVGAGLRLPGDRRDGLVALRDGARARTVRTCPAWSRPAAARRLRPGGCTRRGTPRRWERRSPCPTWPAAALILEAAGQDGLPGTATA